MRYAGRTVAPPDLRAVVRRFEIPLVLRRFGPPVVVGAGLQVRGDPVDTPIRSVVWPTDPGTDRAPDGQQDQGTIAGVSRYELRSAQTSPLAVADVVVWQGQTWEVSVARPWARAGGVTQFWEWEAVRVDLDTVYTAAARLSVGLGLVAS